MAVLTIRNADDHLKLRLRRRAAANDRSMEEEVLQILSAALEDAAPVEERSFAEQVRSRFRALGDVRLEIAPREPVPESRSRASANIGASRRTAGRTKRAP